MSERRGDRDQRDQDRCQRCQGPAPRTRQPERAPLVQFVVPRQVSDEFVQVPNCLGRVATLEALLELAQLEPALGVAGAETFGDPLAIRVSRADGGVST